MKFRLLILSVVSTVGWADEFPLAQECGMDLIEWIFEERDWKQNAIMANPEEIIEISGMPEFDATLILAGLKERGVIG